MKKITLSLMMVLTMICHISCSDDNGKIEPVKGQEATMTITIQGEASTRYEGNETPAPAAETAVSNYTVFVFNWTTGDLERSQSFTVAPGDFTRQVTGLNTGTTKRIVVFVNVPPGTDLGTITRYPDGLNNNLITLDSQNSDSIARTGLFMSGVHPQQVTLNPGDGNTVTVQVRRRVAKVILQSLIVNPASTTPLSNFTLGGVSIQKARTTATPYGGIVAPTGDVTQNYAVGITSPEGATPNFNLVRNYLREEMALPAGYTAGQEVITGTELPKYFYVLPNNGLNNQVTLMTIYGTYGTTPEAVYYPIEINSTTGTGNTDGTYIQSNKIYQLNVTLQQLDEVSEDPNVVPSEVGLSVTIDPQPWDSRINQPVEW